MVMEYEEDLDQVQGLLLELLEDHYVRNCEEKRWPDWGLNPGPSGNTPGALTTELPGLGYYWSAGH